jgi:hypothetical protein
MTTTLTEHEEAAVQAARNARLLGEERRALLAQLAEVEDELAGQMQAMRTGGATWVEIMLASGYTSHEGVKKICDPVRREARNRAERARRARA